MFSRYYNVIAIFQINLIFAGTILIANFTKFSTHKQNCPKLHNIHSGTSTCMTVKL